jgi:hypothetical protein
MIQNFVESYGIFSNFPEISRKRLNLWNILEWKLVETSRMIQNIVESSRKFSKFMEQSRNLQNLLEFYGMFSNFLEGSM